MENNLEVSQFTGKELQFCQEFLIDLNAAASARRAGYSSRTAAQIGHELLQKPKIQQHIQKLIKERTARTQLTSDTVILEFAKIAFSESSKLSEEDDTLRMTMQHKIDSLKLLGEHLGLFSDKPGVTPATSLYQQNISINATSDESVIPEEDKKFMKQLTGPERQHIRRLLERKILAEADSEGADNNELDE